MHSMSLTAMCCVLMCAGTNECSRLNREKYNFFISYHTTAQVTFCWRDARVIIIFLRFLITQNYTDIFLLDRIRRKYWLTRDTHRVQGNPIAANFLRDFLTTSLSTSIVNWFVVMPHNINVNFLWLFMNC
jgi:hypothetical protein